MESLVVECLRCGTARVARRDVFKHLEEPECQRCGYLGWTPLLELALDDHHPPRVPTLAELRRTAVA